VILVKKILLVSLALISVTSICFAAEGNQPKATEPVGAVVETSGVVVGKITSVIEESLGGGKTKGSLVMAEDNGKTRIIPLDPTVKILDNTFHALTLNQLKKGDKVEVESAAGKVKSVKVVK